MCRFFFSSSVLLIFWSASACGGLAEERMDLENQPELNLSWENYRDQARAAGPDESTYYIAEWDLVFPTEAALRAHYEARADGVREKLAVFRQISTAFEPTYSGTEPYDIVYCVSNSFTNKAVVINDMAVAARGWQDAANVWFRYDPSHDTACNQNNADIDFAVLPTNVFGLVGCAANKLLWPAAGGCPIGGNVVTGVLLIKYGAFPQSSPNDGHTPVGVLKHELGHMLGFRHEHPWAPSQGGCAEAPSVAGDDLTGRRLTDYDQASVMHYPSCNGIGSLDYTISGLDGFGAREIYGIPASWYVPILS